MRIRLTESGLINLLEEVLLIEAMSLDQIYAAHYSKGKRKEVPEDVFYKIANADPTKEGDGIGKYTDWMVRLYRKGNLKMEDLYKATEYLKAFHNFKNRIEKKDIGQYQSLPELYRTVKPFIVNPDQATSKSDEVRKIKEGAENVYEDNKWLVIVPHTKEAAIYYGKGTQWCTAATRARNYFDYYNKDGNLYININKETGDKYQFHFESEQFMDVNDRDIEAPIGERIGLTSKLIDFYKKKYRELALPITSKYNLIDINKIKGLDTKYRRYFPDVIGNASQIVEYNDEIGDFQVIATLETPDHFFTLHSLANRFVCIKNSDNGCIDNLYDMTEREIVFKPNDNVASMSVYDTIRNDTKYVVCNLKHPNSDSTYDYQSIYSLEDREFTNFSTEDTDTILQDLALTDKHYKPSLFAAINVDNRRTTIIDVENEKHYKGYYADGTMMALDHIRRKRFRFLKLSTSRFPTYGADRQTMILLYDGELIDINEFENNKLKIISQYT